MRSITFAIRKGSCGGATEYAVDRLSRLSPRLILTFTGLRSALGQLADMSAVIAEVR
jgi:hypothetical protein